MKLSSGTMVAAASLVHAAAPALAQDPTPTAPAPEPTTAPTATPDAGVTTTAPATPAPGEIVPARRPFGRVIADGLAVREQPSIKAALVRVLKLNDIVSIKGQISSDDSPTRYNKTWYQIDDGFSYSAYIQPAEDTPNQPLAEVSEQGFWGEITVPFTEARAAPDPAARQRYLYYYGCVFKVIARVAGPEDTVWYQIEDEYAGTGFYVRAEHIRPIQPEEFTPLSPEVPPSQKRIEVDLTNQVTTAYENDQPVFSARVATGASFQLADGTVQSFRTIPGEHRIFRKTPGQHMVGGTAGDSDFYDLPGIAWVSYFTSSGIAFHGTYWHNDYGRPRSHGCVNMLPEDAQWVFRWTMPSALYEQRWTTFRRTDGTLIKVF